MTSSLPPTDAEMAAAIAEELGWLPSAQGARVRVMVERGVVTLTGRVDTLPEKRAAVEAAFRVRGVVAVDDDVIVEIVHDATGVAGSTNHDADVTRAVIVVLSHTVPAPNVVKAEVRDHVVVLTGAVDWSFQRDAVVRSVEAVVGVAAVVDDVVVRRRFS